MQKILIVEDWKALARGLQALLQAAGHEVVWITGIHSVQPTAAGNIIEGLSDGGENITVSCSDFDAAFVDGQIEGDIQGPAVVALLAADSVACCGMSTSATVNGEMLEAGATMAAKKPVVFAAVLSQKLAAETLLKPTRLDLLRLANLEARFIKDENQGLRHSAEAFLAPFLKEDK